VSAQPPPGYARIDLGKGYSARFGPVYIDRTNQRLAFQVAEQHLNPVDTCHGGALATFSDAMIVAVWPGAESGQAHTPTITLTTDFFAPAPLGAWVEADVELTRQTRTMLFVQSVMSVDGRRIGRASAIYRNPASSGEKA
jgi:uncharacterized protein (TIGR00369 family)